MATPLATHLFNLNWKFKTATRLENYVLALKGVPRTDLYDLQEDQRNRNRYGEMEKGMDSVLGCTYILRHGRVMGNTTAPIHGHLRGRYVNGFALGCIEFPNVGGLRGICINFTGHLDGLMPARTVGDPLARSANRCNCKKEKVRGVQDICIIKEKHWTQLELNSWSMETLQVKGKLLNFPPLNI